MTAGVIPPQVNGQTEIPSEKLVTALRLLNTQEVVYHSLTGRFVQPEEMTILTPNERHFEPVAN